MKPSVPMTKAGGTGRPAVAIRSQPARLAAEPAGVVESGSGCRGQRARSSRTDIQGALFRLTLARAAEDRKNVLVKFEPDIVDGIDRRSADVVRVRHVDERKTAGNVAHRSGIGDFGRISAQCWSGARPSSQRSCARRQPSSASR